MRLIKEHTVVCPAASGAVAPCLLELFERVTGEPFCELPGSLLRTRILSISRVLSNLVAQESFTPPLVQEKKRGLCRWNRCPREGVDWDGWRRRVESEERFSAPVRRPREVMAEVDAGLAAWIRTHRYLQPTEPERGESGMALLLLWEVDHGRPFPTRGGGERSAVLLGFTRRLRARVGADEELRQWMVCQDVQQQLAPGLADTHHFRWSVRIVAPAPAEPQGWYVEFTTRWRAF